MKAKPATKREIKAATALLKRNGYLVRNIEIDNVIGILDVDGLHFFPDKLLNKLEKIERLATYVDSCENMKEDLYSISRIEDAIIEEELILTPKEQKVIAAVSKEMAEKDCGYFRVIF